MTLRNATDRLRIAAPGSVCAGAPMILEGDQAPSARLACSNSCAVISPGARRARRRPRPPLPPPSPRAKGDAPPVVPTKKTPKITGRKKNGTYPHHHEQNQFHRRNLLLRMITPPPRFPPPQGPPPPPNPKSFSSRSDLAAFGYGDRFWQFG